MAIEVSQKNRFVEERRMEGEKELVLLSMGEEQIGINIKK